MNCLFPATIAASLMMQNMPCAASETNPRLIGRADAAAPASVPTVKVAYDRFTLPNGLTTIVHTDRSVPTIFVGIWYRTGSKDEPPGKSGFAHLFEHLMFQQTANRKSDFMVEMAKVGAAGMNGSTTIDFTSYFQTVPTNALDTALWLESDRMGYLDGGITQTVLDEQRAVVQNEKRQQQTPVAEEAQDRFYSAYYPLGHPYGHSTIGSMADLNAATLDDVKTWFTDHYGASNAVLVLAGDIDLATAKDKVTRYFGAMRPGKALGGPKAWVPTLAASRRDVLYADGAEAQLSRTWPVSRVDPRDSTLLLLAGRTMTAVRDSPFVHALVDEMRVANGVDAQFDANLLDANFIISMALRPGVTPEQAGAALDTAIDRFASMGPTPGGLQSIRRGTDTSILRSLDDNASVANFLVDGEIRHGDPLFFLKQRNWALAATPEEVRNAARTWLKRPYYEQATLPPPARTVVVGRDVDRTSMPTPGPLKTAVALPPITEMRLENGLKVVVAERHSIPLVDVAMHFRTGTDADAAYVPGTATAAFKLMRMGTPTMSARQLAEATTRLDVPIASSVGNRTGTVQWSAGTQQLERSFALAADFIRNPSYTAIAVKDAVADTERSLSSALSPSARADALLANAIWGDADPRGRLAVPSDYRRLDRDAVARFHDREVGPTNATLLMTGDVTPAKARALAERHFGDWRPNVPVDVATLPPTRVQQPRIILLDAAGAAQSSITVGEVVPPFDKDRDAAEQVANAVLADGTNGRLNMNLRETKGWTYVFSGSIDGEATGDRLFIAGGSVQADKTAEAILEIRREIGDLVAARPIGQAELSDVRDSAVRSVPLSLHGSPNLLSAMGRASAYGLPYARIGGSAERLANVTLDQARAAAARLYSPDHLVWIVVGDLNSIEAPIRALNIAPVEVWDATGKRLR